MIGKAVRAVLVFSEILLIAKNTISIRFFMTVKHRQE